MSVLFVNEKKITKTTFTTNNLLPKQTDLLMKSVIVSLVTAKSWFNDQAYHAVGVALNAVDNAILKNVTGNVSKQITVTNHPLPRTLMQKSDDLDEYVNV